MRLQLDEQLRGEGGLPGYQSTYSSIHTLSYSHNYLVTGDSCYLMERFLKRYCVTLPSSGPSWTSAVSQAFASLWHGGDVQVLVRYFSIGMLIKKRKKHYWFSTLLNITFEVNNFLWLDCYHYLIILTLRNVHTFAQHYQNHMIERHLHHTTTSTSITPTVHQKLLSYHRHLPYSKCVQIKLLHINPATILYLISRHIYV